MSWKRLKITVLEEWRMLKDIIEKEIKDSFEILILLHNLKNNWGYFIYTVDSKQYSNKMDLKY